MRVIEGSEAQVEACLDIARALRTHFNDNAMVQMPEALGAHRLYVAEEDDEGDDGQDDRRDDGRDDRRDDGRDDGAVVGFLTLLRRSPDVGEISWMGVMPDQQRQGIGTSLVGRAARDLATNGATIMMVHTLADSVEYEPYEATRSFYRAVGFKHLETIDPFPGMAPGDAIAIYVKAL
jgi:ribosomal protein S18 acetylase RimI-like enzyme